MWEPQREALAGHVVFAPDLYGLGSTMDEWAEAVLRDVEGEFVAVGASMGGYCALALARLARERVSGLVLVGARADADSPERREGRARTIALIREQGNAGLWENQRSKLFSDEAPEEAVELARSIALRQDPDALIRGIEAMRDRPDSGDVLASLEAPVLIALGEHDPFFPESDARRFAESAPGARLVVFPRAGHLPSLERPEEFNRELTEFFSPWR